MARIAFHLELYDGNRDAYREAHEDVPEALEEAYLDEEAGLQAYSLFEKDGHVFGYLTVEDPVALDEAVGASEVLTEWDERMDDVIAEQTELDEVYRMI